MLELIPEFSNPDDPRSRLQGPISLTDRKFLTVGSLNFDDYVEGDGSTLIYPRYFSHDNPDLPDPFALFDHLGALVGKYLHMHRSEFEPTKDNLQYLLEAMGYNRVSNEHFTIFESGNGYSVMDTKSTNGTRLNGRNMGRGRHYALVDGDTITICNENPFMSFNVALKEETQYAKQPRRKTSVQMAVLVGFES